MSDPNSNESHTQTQPKIANSITIPVLSQPQPQGDALDEIIRRQAEASEAANEAYLARLEINEARRINRRRQAATEGPGGWTGQRELVMRNAATIEPQAVDWLWTGWIAKGFINIIAGETGAGKSTVLADVVARVTTGAAWPGEDCGRAPGQVLWLGSEDPPQLMTVPRLMAAKADLENVNFIEGAKMDGKALTVSLQDDFVSMSRALGMARERGQPISMIVIDPVTSYLSGGVLKKVDMNDAGQIRTVLEPWSVLSAGHNVAVVCVTHFAKDTNRAMLHRVLGSGAFTALARSTISITKLPDAAQNGDLHAKAMFQIKTNLPEQPEGGWRFTTMKTTVFGKANRPISATKVDWDELDSALTPESIIGLGKERGPVSQFAIEFPLWLKAQFASVPADQGFPISELKRRALTDGVATESTWEKHSAKFLDKKNVGGIWLCRPL